MKMKGLCLGWLFTISCICFGGNEVSYTDSSKPIILGKVEQTFIVTMDSNPTTGYMWYLKSYDRNLIVPVSHEFSAPAVDNKTQDGTSGRMVGVPGFEKWTFRVKPVAFVVPHVTSVSFVHIRPWEKEQEAQPVVYKIIIKDSN